MLEKYKEEDEIIDSVDSLPIGYNGPKIVADRIAYKLHGIVINGENASQEIKNLFNAEWDYYILSKL